MNKLRFRLDVNGKTVQEGNTERMIFPVDVQISYISRFITLKTGDLLFTGTPEGVGPVQPGDRLEAWLEEANGDAALIAKALGDIARAKGMTQVARDAGLSRESLYKALSGERTPGFDTILKVVGALDLKLHVGFGGR